MRRAFKLLNMEKKETANKSAAKPKAKETKASEKKAAYKPSASDSERVEIVGVKGPLKKDQKYTVSAFNAKLLVDKGVAKKA